MLRGIYLLSALIFLSGCGPAQPRVASSNRPRSDFARSITGADCVTINYVPELEDGRGFEISLNGDKVRDIINAVSAAIDQGEAKCHCGYDVELHFWKGGSHLGMVNFTGSSVRAGGIQYFDNSGILDELEKQKVFPMNEKMYKQAISNHTKTNKSSS
jgi:hypothetical protein